MKTSYFTFGFGHAHQFNGITLDHNIVLKITSEDPRDLMFAMFGPKWAFEYDSFDEVSLSYYPRGIYEIDVSNNKVGEVND